MASSGGGLLLSVGPRLNVVLVAGQELERGHVWCSLSPVCRTGVLALLGFGDVGWRVVFDGSGVLRRPFCSWLLRYSKLW